MFILRLADVGIAVIERQDISMRCPVLFLVVKNVKSYKIK
jgi:hypothetical protein